MDVVDLVTRLPDRRLRNRGSITYSEKRRVFPKLPDLLCGSPSSCSSTGGALCLVVQRPGRDANHSPPASAKVKNDCSCACTPPHALVADTETHSNAKHILEL